MQDITLSEKAKKVKLGIYEHYKKRRYEVIGVALHSETTEEMIIYKALYGDGITWIRPFALFFEDVEINGIKRARFILIEEFK